MWNLHPSSGHVPRWLPAAFMAAALSFADSSSVIKIIRATYGTDTKEVDVTDLLASKVAGGSISMNVGNHTLGGDPVPGVSKRLYVRYESEGSEHEVRVEEGGILTIPSREPAPNERGPSSSKTESKESPKPSQYQGWLVASRFRAEAKDLDSSEIRLIDKPMDVLPDGYVPINIFFRGMPRAQVLWILDQINAGGAVLRIVENRKEKVVYQVTTTTTENVINSPNATLAEAETYAMQKAAGWGRRYGISERELREKYKEQYLKEKRSLGGNREQRTTTDTCEIEFGADDKVAEIHKK